MKNKKMIFSILGIIICVVVFALCLYNRNTEKLITTSSGIISNKKIGWGIKRADNHEQPDLGKTNKELIEKYDGIAIGNPEKKYVYLTFDEGYEAGYTAKILDILKDNDVKACFFITGHYLNTASDLVKRMIDEGHIVRKPYC